MTILQFGKVQLQIMKILWAKRRVTARELTDELNKLDPIAHSTVQTLLRTLENKKAVAHEEVGRTFYFYPLVEDDTVTRKATDNFIKHVFDGSPSGMVSFLVKNKYLSQKELKEIEKLIRKE